MAENGVRLDLVETRFRGHAEKLAREAVGSGARMVVAAGGDGTIAEVANGLIGSSARLGVIPLGTANVLARELSLPFAPRAVAAALAFGRTTMLWPGIATSSDGSRLFVQMLGIGFDAQVVHRLNPGMKRIFGRGAYVLQGVRELVRYEFAPLTVSIDGVRIAAGSVIVSKGRLYGGGHLLAPDAEPGKPGFSIALFALRGGSGAAMAYGAALPTGLLPHMPGVRRLRGSRIDIFGDASVPAQADGDPAGRVPLSIQDVAAPIQLVVG